MTVFKEFGLVMEDKNMKENLGIEKLCFSKVTIDLTTLIAFRESLNDDGEYEPYTYITYDDFCIIFHTEVMPVLNKDKDTPITHFNNEQ
jgi:hypothetical protein